MTKTDKIKEAYGDYSDIALELCDENGWIEYENYHDYFPQDKENFKNSKGFFMRPRSLKGIEHNNGWNNLSEEVFPEDNDTVFWYSIDNGEFEIASLLHCDFNWKDYTHWHPLPPKAPVY